MKSTLLIVLAAASLPACGESRSAPPAAQATPFEVVAGGLRFDVPAEWVSEEPSSSMRLAQLRLPGEAGDASLVVYWFGGGGGGIEANMGRWIGQFETPDGGSADELAVRATSQQDGLSLHSLELYGTYVAETSPGSGERYDDPDHGLLACVVEAPDGLYYVKLVGPEGTIRAWKSEWQAALRSMRSAG